jgi:hypothetical protein
MADLKITDFDQMLTTSTAIGNEYDVPTEDILVQIVDEDDEIYDIKDVKFNLRTRSILIEFSHDNDD